MKQLTGIMLILLVFLAACAGNQTSIGDGQVDAVETATLRLAVGLAFAQMPEAIKPAHEISGAVLLVLAEEPDATALAALVDKVIAGKLEELDMDAYKRAAFLDLLALIRAQIVAQLDLQADKNKVVILRQLVQIIHYSAELRLSPIISGEEAG